MRARRLAHWYEQGLDACPSMNAINKILTTGTIPEYLLVENITPYFRPGKASEEAVVENDECDEDFDDVGDNEGHDSEQECGDVLLHSEEPTKVTVVEKVKSPVKLSKSPVKVTKPTVLPKVLKKPPVFKKPSFKKVSHTEVKPQQTVSHGATTDIAQLI